MKDLEIEAMEKINEALSVIKDDSARERVLKWAAEKFYKSTGTTLPEGSSQLLSAKPAQDSLLSKDEIPGIAKVKKDGKFEITIRDLKAKSKRDAALRFVLVFIRAHEKLTGKVSVSSRKSLTPALRDGRLYDPNIRYMIANYAGILRQKDELSLDTPAKAEADKFMKEILDPNIKGKWSHTARIIKKRGKRKVANEKK